MFRQFMIVPQVDTFKKSLQAVIGNLPHSKGNLIKNFWAKINKRWRRRGFAPPLKAQEAH